MTTIVSRATRRCGRSFALDNERTVEVAWVDEGRFRYLVACAFAAMRHGSGSLAAVFEEELDPGTHVQSDADTGE